MYPCKISSFSTVALLLALSLPAQAMNICVDKSGKKTLQDQPCANVQAQVSNEPVRTGVLSLSGAQETIRRFNAVLNEKNAKAASLFITSSFSAEYHKPGKNAMADNASQFLSLLGKMLSSADEYQVTRICTQTPETNKDAFIFSCNVNERMKIKGKESGGDSNEIIRLILSEGAIKIDEIKSYIPETATHRKFGG